MGQAEAERVGLQKLGKVLDKVNNFFRVFDGKALLPGHYYKGAEGVVIKVVKRTASGKTVYITTHTDGDAPSLQTKRVKIHTDGNEYICYKNKHYVIGTWNETDREAFLSYINSNIGKPIAII